MSERTLSVTSVGEVARAGRVLTQSDADAVEPRVSGFLQRFAKTSSATLTGELPFGTGSMNVEFEVLRATLIEGIWCAAEIPGDGQALGRVRRSSCFDGTFA